MQSSNTGSQKAALACTCLFTVVIVIGWLGIAGFYAPVAADLGMQATKTWFTQTNQTATLIGCTFLYIAAGLLTPSSLQFGLMLAKLEGRRPVWSITTAVCGIFISLIIFFNACAWIVAAYRPEFGADVIQAFYDWAWMAFLLGWFYLAMEMVACGVVELQDKRPTPMIPRWFTGYTFFGAIALVGAAGPAFFKSGPFAYHGLFGFYVPVIVWGIYLNGTAFFMYQELNREAASANTESATASGE